jgi:hypothetical protein
MNHAKTRMVIENCVSEVAILELNQGSRSKRGFKGKHHGGIVRESLAQCGSNITDWRVYVSQATSRRFCGALDSAEALPRKIWPRKTFSYSVQIGVSIKHVIEKRRSRGRQS